MTHSCAHSPSFAHLVKDSIRRVVDDLEDTGLAGPGAVYAQRIQTEVSEASGVHYGHDLLEVVRRRGRSRGPKAPFADGMDLKSVSASCGRERYPARPHIRSYDLTCPRSLIRLTFWICTANLSTWISGLELFTTGVKPPQGVVDSSSSSKPAVGGQWRMKWADAHEASTSGSTD
jgi:hypothetical protein